jgi:DHA2 family multidrug resistance protein
MITASVMLATIMQALDTTIANVALPYMQGSFAASQDQINWVLTSYIVAAAIMTPPTGWLANRFGRRRLFLAAVGGFTFASILCGMAGSLGQIVAFRLMQGMFGAALVPLSQAVLLDTYPPERQGSAMAIWGAGVMVGPILGPTLGGWLTEYWNWRWVFYINLPFGLLAFLGIWTFISDPERRAASGFDWFGFAMLSLGVGALQLMLDRGEQLDWFSSREIVLEACLAAVGLYLFAVQTATARQPFINPTIFRDRNFSIGIIFIFVVGIILLATLALLTPYLQSLMGYPVLDAGLVQSPRGIGTMIVMIIAGRLVGKVDVRLMILAGFSLTAWSLWRMTGFTPDVAQSTLIFVSVIQGFGLGFIFVPLSTITFSTLRPEFRAEGTGVFSLMRNLGSSVGISIMTVLLTRNTQMNHALVGENVTPFNHALAHGSVARIWDLSSLAGRAALDAEITRQATVIAFVNDFKVMMIVCLCAIPMILLLRRPPRRAGEHAAVAVE